MTLPKINRRDALALWLQGRRRGRRAPLLRPQYPGLLVWEWPYANPYKWLVYWGHSDLGPWNFVEDYWHYGASRQFAPDGGSPYHLVVGVDQFGNEVTGRSNAVRPDDAPEPLTLLDDLWAYWKTDEAAGSARWDSYIGGFDLEEWSFDEAAGGETHFPIQYCGGVIGGAAQFYFGPGLGLITSSNITLPDGDFTFACWFTYNSSEGFDGQGLISVGGTVWMGIRAYDGAANFGVHYTGGDTSATTPNGTVLEDDWTHVAFVREGGTLRIYLNGVQQASTTFAGALLAQAVGYFSGTDFLVGINPWGYPLVGAVDELGCWQRALSAVEVSQLYNSGDGLAYEFF